MDLTLRGYQQEAVDWFAAKGRGLLCDTMGLGKTITSIACLKEVGGLPFLVICPKSIIGQWVREIRRMGLTAQSLLDKKVEKVDAYVVNYEMAYRCSLPRVVGLIVDEFHWIKNEKAKRSLRVAQIAKDVKNLVLLSGTPVTNTPKDLIMPLRVLGIFDRLFGNQRGKGAWKRYVDRYCDFRLDWQKHPRYGASNTKELHTILKRSGYYLRREKEQVLDDLPAKNREVLYVSLKKKRAPYLLCREEIKAVLCRDESKWKRNKILAQMTNMRKLCCEEKLPYAQQWIADFKATGHQLIVFGHHKAFLTELAGQEALLTGETSSKKRSQAIDAFSAGEIQLLYLNMTVGGVGLNLTSAHNVLFFEIPWAYADMVQCEDRVHRIGQNAKMCNYYYFLVESTLDTYMWEVLNRKKATLNAVSTGLDKGAIAIDNMIDGFLEKNEFARVV